MAKSSKKRTAVPEPREDAAPRPTPVAAPAAAAVRGPAPFRGEVWLWLAAFLVDFYALSAYPGVMILGAVGLLVSLAVLRRPWFDAVYRFLASLKLAVISLGLLAAALAYATFFERNHGTPAAQEYIYQTRGFALLLAFLAANILCAALIRFPWKRRQIGFVVTHAGLLTLLAGCWYAKMSADEGTVAISEGDVKKELVRNDLPVVRVRQLDPHNAGEVLHEWELPYRPGAFAWGPGEPRPYPFLDTLNPLALILSRDSHPEERLTPPGFPFQLVVKSHIPTSAPALEHVADPDGMPMARIRPTASAPGMPEPREIFGDGPESWFTAPKPAYKSVKDVFPAKFSFAYVDRPELVDDFLNPPADPGTDGVARFRYTDKTGKPRTFDWKVDAARHEPFTLPDSDLSVSLVERIEMPMERLSRTLGSESTPLLAFDVTKASDPPLKHYAWGGLPMFPNVIPNSGDPQAPAPRPLVSINYDRPPTLEATGTGTFGVVEVLGTPGGSTYYRVWGRPQGQGTLGVVRSKGEVKRGQTVQAFGGGAGGGPATITFRVDQFLPSAVENEIAEPVVLGRGQMGNGIAASQVEMTIKGEDGRPESRNFFIRRSPSYEPVWKTVRFGHDVYEVSYDVDREPLGFQIKLIDFDRKFDPGTEQASAFRSDVLLTDDAKGIVDKPHRIQMNEPLEHRGFRFYQASYIREQDPQTGRETGRVQSVLQVGKNPGRGVIYAGCILVVLGSFLQFYMRAGLFTDGGRRERERAAARAREAARARGETPPEPAELAAAVATPARPDEVDL